MRLPKSALRRRVVVRESNPRASLWTMDDNPFNHNELKRQPAAIADCEIPAELKTLRKCAAKLTADETLKDPLD
jgi:hypothetical protein